MTREQQMKKEREKRQDAVKMAALRDAEKAANGANRILLQKSAFRAIGRLEITLSECSELKSLYNKEFERRLQGEKREEKEQLERLNRLFPLKDPRATIWPTLL